MVRLLTVDPNKVKEFRSNVFSIPRFFAFSAILIGAKKLKYESFSQLTITFTILGLPGCVRKSFPASCFSLLCLMNFNTEMGSIS